MNVKGLIFGEKSDIIRIKGGSVVLNNEIVRLEFQKIGLFCSEEDWIHPKASVPTYEIIYVVEGQVHIEEQGKRYSLQPGDLILLRPFFLHQGFQKSETPTKFYWLHLNCLNAFVVFLLFLCSKS